MRDTYFTDQEYRILLAALGRERKVCEKVDQDCGEEYKLIRIMNSIEKKIHNIQYKKVEHTYDNCRNITCRRRCEKDGYDKAINNCKSVIDNAYVQEYIDGFTYAIITENYEQLKAGK